MATFDWAHKLFKKPSRSSRRGGQGAKRSVTHRLPLRLEVLEERLAPAISVAVVGGTNNDSGFQAIAAQLNDRTYFNFSASVVPYAQLTSPQALSAYDVVVIGNNGAGSGGDGFDNAGFTAALRQWVQAGHGVVATGWTVYGAGPSTGTPIADIAAIVPVNTSAYGGYFAGEGDWSVQPNGAASPVTAGVAPFVVSSGDDIEYSQGGLNSGATVLATTNGQATVATGHPGAGRSVYLGPTYSAAKGPFNNADLISGPADRLLEQAVAWAANIPFTAIDDSATVSHNGGTISVLANDRSPYNDPLVVSAVTQGANGTVAVAGGGSAVRYVPAPGFAGIDSFTYTASDGHGGTSSATVIVNVAPPITVSPSPSSLPNPKLGVPYSQTITATGGTDPKSFKRTGDLPPGISFDLTSGQLSGTRTGSGLFAFTITVTDSLKATASQSYAFDDSPPFVDSIVPSSPTDLPTNADKVSFTVTFNKPVTGVNESKFRLAKTGTIGANLIQVKPADDSGAVYTATVSGITGSGTLGLNVVDNGTIRDLGQDPYYQPDSSLAFDNPQAFPIGSDRLNSTAYLNGDGVSDLITSSWGHITVRLGNGDGTFSPPPSNPAGFTTRGGYVAAVADLRGNGTRDLIVREPYIGRGVGVLLGNGDGTFQNEQFIPLGTDPASVVVADLGNGKLDLIVGNIGTTGTVSSLTVLLGNGDGTFQSPMGFDAGIDPYWLKVADVNGDRVPDVVATNAGGGVSVLLGNGDGTFKPPHSFDAGPDASSLVLEDFGNGKLDIAVLNRLENTVSVLLGNGDGTFQSRQTFATGDLPSSLAAANLDVHGNLDLVVTNQLSDSVSVLVGNGDGTFQNQQSFATVHRPNAVAVADVNSDGQPDILIGNGDAFGGAGSVSSLRNLIHRHFTSQQLYTIDHVSPFVRSITADDNLLTASSTVSYTVTFSKAVAGVDPSDFQLARSNTLSASDIQVTPVSDSVYTVTVSGINGKGTLGLNLVDNGSIHDVAGNSLTQANTTASFQGQVTYATDAGPQSVAVGDLNRDGKPDIVTVNSGSYLGGGSASVLLGNGDGSFASDRRLFLGGSPTAVAVSNLGSGPLNLVIASHDYANQGGSVVILFGNNSGDFISGESALFDNYSFPTALAVADVDGNGQPDLIVPAGPVPNAGRVTVLLNFGGGPFFRTLLPQPPLYTGGLGSDAVAVADVNGDGAPDLITTSLNSNTVSVLLGNGDGTFGQDGGHSFLFATGSAPTAVAVADVNGDGNPDIITANLNGNNVSVLLGNGDGTFQPALNLPVGLNPTSAVIADINGDGKPDLVVANGNFQYGNGSVSVLLGNGDGTFQPQQTFAVGSQPNSVAVGDFNGDGRPDLVVTNGNGPGGVSVLLNSVNGNFTGPVYTVNIDSQVLQTILDQLSSASGGSPTNVAFAPGSPAELNTVIDAVNGLAAQSVATTITVALSSGSYGDMAPSPHAGVTLLVKGDGTETFYGHSPALSVSEGIVILVGVNLSTATDSPTIVVTGGTLVLRDDVINESTAFRSAAISITGGTVDLGSADDPGNNILNISGVGEFVRNATTNPVPEVGNFFKVDGNLSPNIFTVESMADSGPLSLRQAILDANATPNDAAGPDVIQFNIAGGGVQTIAPTTALPIITDAVTIDGWSQPGFAGAPLIELNGAGAGNAYGLAIETADTTIRGLVINRFAGDGIALFLAPRAWIAGNYIGVDPTGTIAEGNGSGIVVSYSDQVIVGSKPDGKDLLERNLISGNGGNDGAGIGIDHANGVIVRGNYLGTDVTGNADFSFIHNNDGNIKANDATNLNILGNLISGGAYYGILLYPNVDHAVIQANRIGTNADGKAALGNGFGIYMIYGIHDILVGGTNPGDGNLISGNGTGVIVASSDCHDITFLGNKIGTDVYGNKAIPNQAGISIAGSKCLVGGIIPGARNLISGNAGYGIVFNNDDTLAGSRVEGNYIGTDITGDHAIGNGGGVSMGGYGGGGFNTLGGTNPAARNIISGNNGRGVLVDEAGNLVENNFIGTDSTGLAAVPNGYYGIDVRGTANSVIDNIVSGNSVGGIFFWGSSNVLQGNTIGTDVTGNAALPNHGSGVSLSSSHGGLIGGPGDGQGNLISGNTGNGVDIFYPSDSSGNKVQGNRIGTKGAGTAALGNGGDGVFVYFQAYNDNVIGGSGVGEGNVISGNQGDGVAICTSSVVVQGNSIGTDAGGTLHLGNVGAGVSASYNTRNDVIGGVAPGAGNTIAYNGSDGVQLQQASSFTVRGNSIHDNAGLGINLGPYGGNNQQSFPVLIGAVAGPTTSVGGRLNSTPNGTFNLDFYANVIADPSGYGEGQRYLGSITVATDAGGNASFVAAGLGPTSAGEFISATATDAVGDTSAFSLDLAAGTLTVSASASGAFVHQTITLQATAYASGVALDHVDFLVDGTDKGAGTLNNGVWSFSVDTTALSDGSHKWSATAFDLAGNSTASASRSFTVDNTAPAISLGSPADGALVHQTISLQASASDVNLDHVDFLVDGTGGAGTLNNGVWSFSVDTTALSDGSHKWSATAFDLAGNSTAASNRSFTVDNTAPKVTSLSAVTPSSRNTPVTTIDVTFSEPIDLSTFDSHDTSLTRNGNPVTLTSGVTVAALGGATYRISGLGSVNTADGTYVLTVNSAGVQDLAGNGGTTDSVSDTWLLDTVAPTSRVNALSASQTSLSFSVGITGSDPNPSGGVASGVKSYDVYVAADNNPFPSTPYTTVPAGAKPSFTFTAQDNHSYYFRSIARDVAGNVEAKTVTDAGTYVPDLTPPATQVKTVDSSKPAFTVNWTGTDAGGSGLSVITLFAQVDGGAVQQIGQYPAGTPAGGTYSGSAAYQAIADGNPHTYAFSSVGTDNAKNVEAAHSRPDVTVSQVSFAKPASLQVAGITLNKNSQLTEHSYIRYLDVNFNESDPAIQALATSTTNSSQLYLNWLGLNGLGTPTVISLTGQTTVKANGSVLSIDFGPNGITNNFPATAPAVAGRTSRLGDGYYELGVKVPSNTTLTKLHFFRLLGDVTGDGKVDLGDYNEVNAHLNQTAPPAQPGQPVTILNDDVDGSGRVDANDRNLVYAAKQKSAAVVTTGLPWTLDAVQILGAAGSAGVVAPLTEREVTPLLAAAIGRWRAAGLDAAGISNLKHLQIRIGYLPGPDVGLYGAGVIYLDRTADGHGWFIDPTPSQDEEFQGIGPGGGKEAIGAGLAVGRVDLLTVLEHEMGHALGLEHTSSQAHPGDVMNESLVPGERKVVSTFDVQQALAAEGTSTSTAGVFVRTEVTGEVAPLGNELTLLMGPYKPTQPLVVGLQDKSAPAERSVGDVQIDALAAFLADHDAASTEGVWIEDLIAHKGRPQSGWHATRAAALDLLFTTKAGGEDDPINEVSLQRKK